MYDCPPGPESAWETFLDGAYNGSIVVSLPGIDASDGLPLVRTAIVRHDPETDEYMHDPDPMVRAAFIVGTMTSLRGDFASAAPPTSAYLRRP